MNVLVIDIGGTNVKILATGQTAMAERVKQAKISRSEWLRDG
jgi:sugar (pentulose or hexulose) kinase